MNTNQLSTGYLFTKEQAKKVARDFLVSYHENVAECDQDADRLAYRISGALEIAPHTRAVCNALESLDQLALIENGTHEDLDVNRSGTIDNTPELLEYHEIELAMAIDDIVERFVDHYELAA